MMSKNNFIIPLIIYPFDVMFSFEQTDKELLKILSKSISSEDAEDKELWGLENMGLGRTVRFNSGQLLIRMRIIPLTEEGYGILQHEIFHAVELLFSLLKTPLCKETSEAYAYLIQYITTEVYKKLNF